MENLSLVLDNLKCKRDRLSGHEHIRPLLLILPGGMRGAAGAGSILALHQAGFANVFQAVVGISTGAPIGAYFLSGHAASVQGASLYYQDLATPEFINLRRLKNIMRLDILLSAMENGPKAIDVNAIQESRTDFFVTATTMQGESKFINAKTAKPSLIEAMHASMAMPGGGPEPVEVNGQRYVDGGLFPFPLRQIVERFHPTDILVVPNFPKPADGIFHLTAKDFFGSLFVLRTGSIRLTRLAILRRQKLTQGLREAEETTGVRIGILWPPKNQLHHFTTDAKSLRDAAFAAGQKTLTDFGVDQPLRLL